MNDPVKQLLHDVSHTFRQMSDQKKAAGMKAYMKNQFEFLGIPSPARKSLYPAIKHNVKKLNHEQFLNFCKALWQLPQREYQYLAMDLLNSFKKNLKFEDLPVIETLVLQKSWWDTVDALAADAVGAIMSRTNEEKILEKTEQWCESNNMWLQRTAILFQLKYKEKTNEGLLFDLIERLQDSKEFFIRKAAGWALRQYARTHPLAVKDFVESHPGLSGLTRREALKHIGETGD